MAILAATAIISLEDSGIIGRSRNTVNTENYNNEYQRLIVIKNGILTDNLGTITIDEYISELTNKGLIESTITTNTDGTKTVTTRTGFLVTISQNGNNDLNISFNNYTDSANTSNTNNNSNDETSTIPSTAKSFTLNYSGSASSAYTATVYYEDGMTWGELIASSTYNRISRDIDSAIGCFYASGTKVAFSPDGVSVALDAPLANSAEYTLTTDVIAPETQTYALQNADTSIVYLTKKPKPIVITSANYPNAGTISDYTGYTTIEYWGKNIYCDAASKYKIVISEDTTINYDETNDIGDSLSISDYTNTGSDPISLGGYGSSTSDYQGKEYTLDNETNGVLGITWCSYRSGAFSISIYPLDADGNYLYNYEYSIETTEW